LLEDKGDKTRELRIVPKWFDKELRLIDPDYRAVYNPNYDCFEIKSRLAIRRGNVPLWLVYNLAVFKPSELNQQALENLRHRKYLGRKDDTTAKRIKRIKDMNEEAKLKRRKIAYEMMTEGFLKIDQFHKKKYFDFGGHYGTKKSRSNKTD